MRKELGNCRGGLSIVELESVLRELAKQVKATRKLYLSYQGVVTETVEVPDHDVQLRALIELVKLHGLYPRRGERESGHQYDRSEKPVINLVTDSPHREASF